MDIVWHICLSVGNTRHDEAGGKTRLHVLFRADQANFFRDKMPEVILFKVSEQHVVLECYYYFSSKI